MFSYEHSISTSFISFSIAMVKSSPESQTASFIYPAPTSVVKHHILALGPSIKDSDKLSDVFHETNSQYSKIIELFEPNEEYLLVLSLEI